jgi:hypothetical protein
MLETSHDRCEFEVHAQMPWSSGTFQKKSNSVVYGPTRGEHSVHVESLPYLTELTASFIFDCAIFRIPCWTLYLSIPLLDGSTFCTCRNVCGHMCSSSRCCKCVGPLHKLCYSCVKAKLITHGVEYACDAR